MCSWRGYTHPTPMGGCIPMPLQATLSGLRGLKSKLMKWKGKASGRWGEPGGEGLGCALIKVHYWNVRNCQRESNCPIWGINLRWSIWTPWGFIGKWHSYLLFFLWKVLELFVKCVHLKKTDTIITIAIWNIYKVAKKRKEGEISHWAPMEL